ncbi:hypothetical protein Ahy_A07g032595 [Arachis hypogaea]|uniref:Uncharacterized protein n=1 Tax=Arachis hypogaea TaxID=3818 RepID=A0A445C786_ARAHY|nr:hypothetical protein Ahy_A07g032595 [Arachis hypogaea]
MTWLAPSLSKYVPLENTNATNQWQHLENHTGISMQWFKCSSFAQRIRTEHDRMATGKPILFVNNSILS